MRRASRAGVSDGPVPCPPDRGPYAGTKGMGRRSAGHVPGRTFFHDPQARQKDRVRWMGDEDGDACDVQHGVTLVYSIGAGTRAPRTPGPCCCRSPLSIVMCAAVEHSTASLTSRAGSGRTIRGRHKVGKLAGKPSFAAPSSSRAAPGVFVGRGWLGEWYGPMLCQVQISHKLANEMRHVAMRVFPRSAVGAHQPGPDRAANMIHAGIQWIMSIIS